MGYPENCWPIKVAAIRLLDALEEHSVAEIDPEVSVAARNLAELVGW